MNSQLPNNSDTRMRKQQVAALKKRFLDTIQRYQDVERNYQLRYRQRIERQIRIVKPDATQEEVDSIIDSDGPPQIFAQSELHQLFMDMSMMVEQQGETLTTIENHAEQTEGHIKEGNTFISKAIQSAKSTRTYANYKLTLFFLFLGRWRK
ncbi:hypothetical protein RO3G_11658 [Rhizopus delemar RA 99-880]|uniref:t-SNARE coiled-coil homology domain-containing protein n=1 Tax=Rhizopus delemar (strain RA 99-880 / ATCC MYA-4621 / FGSC 9543 / NRRL 43880) TaxID=246409 RepID=I1CER7_RHIO9|nr:hypothetical protein RO3G_11658 [Rhizopus delemar RA 99-880]|eukprot:EIE86947.1 hypothetical protein RO3G_11658 [Rhizopus delemar RA 99-880]